MNDIDKLKSLALKSNFKEEDLDVVYNQILMPMFIEVADKWKRNYVQISENNHRYVIKQQIEQLFGIQWTLEKLVLTEMKPYLNNKGYSVTINGFSTQIKWN